MGWINMGWTILMLILSINNHPMVLINNGMNEYGLPFGNLKVRELVSMTH